MPNIQSVDEYLSNGCGRCEYFKTPKCKVLPLNVELRVLRDLILSTGLSEEIKWGVPCYTFNDKNVVNVSALKDCVALGFFKGVLLTDTHQILSAPGENSRYVRLIKFRDVNEISALNKQILSYIKKAIELEKQGKKVKVQSNAEPIPLELKNAFERDMLFKKAFYKLTPGRQRGYLLHFNQPKQSKTKIARISKWKQAILDGEGMHDGYKKQK